MKEEKEVVMFPIAGLFLCYSTSNLSKLQRQAHLSKSKGVAFLGYVGN